VIKNTRNIKKNRSIWKKNKNELSQEDYDNFYSEKHYGFDKPIKHIHIIEGLPIDDPVEFTNNICKMMI